jgi:GTP-binding protein
MIIKTVEYAGTIAQPGGASPGTLPRIAFTGRSNVGKSSLINTLLRRTRKRIARVSATPGKTRTINFFLVNERFFLVDLPGYGYAKVPKGIRDSWSELIEWYLGSSGGVNGLVHLMDARRDPTDHDLHMISYLSELGVPTLVVLTKMDKLKATQREKAIRRTCEGLSIGEDQILPFSSKTGEGRDTLLEALDELVAEAEAGGGAKESEVRADVQAGETRVEAGGKTEGGES